MEKIINFIKENKALAIGAGALALLLLFRGARRRSTRRRRSLPVRSIKRRSSTRRKYNKAPGTKKPWQVKGSEAARRYMAKIRKLR